MVIVLVFFGGAIGSGVLRELRWEDAIAGGAMLLPIRAASGLLGNPLPAAGRALIAFFGIRDLRTFYSLAYAMNRTRFEEAPRLWALASLVVLASVLFHGVTSTPIMNWLDRRRKMHRKERNRSEGECGGQHDQLAKDHAL